MIDPMSDPKTDLSMSVPNSSPSSLADQACTDSSKADLPESWDYEATIATI